MNNQITVCDYSADWALIDRFVDERTTPGYMTREEVIAFFGTMGVDAIELFHAYWGDMPVSHVKNLCEEAGLPIYNYTIFADMLYETPQKRLDAVDEACRRLDRAAALGAKLSMILPAIVKTGFSLSEQRAWLVEGLRKCAEHAQSVGVLLACENLDYPPSRPLLGTGKDCHDICADVGHVGFRLIFDSCAPLFSEEDPVDALKAMWPFLVHVHLKNSRVPYRGEKVNRYRDSIHGTRFTGTVLDGGLVPIPTVLAELRALDYSGSLQIEYQGEYDPRLALNYNLQFVRQQMVQ